MTTTTSAVLAYARANYQSAPAANPSTAGENQRQQPDCQQDVADLLVLFYDRVRDEPELLNRFDRALRKHDADINNCANSPQNPLCYGA